MRVACPPDINGECGCATTTTHVSDTTSSGAVISPTVDLAAIRAFSGSSGKESKRVLSIFRAS
jgi:hypothetical protein